MKFSKITHYIFVAALIILWSGYAVANLIARFPYIKVGFKDGWDIPSTMESLIDAANGGVLFQQTFQDINGNWLNIAGT